MQKTAYEMRISDWSSDVCSSDLCMLRRSPGLLAVGLLMWLLFAVPLPAQDVPPPLRDWQGWVLHDVPQHDCPFMANRTPGAGGRQCAWPGRLMLDEIGRASCRERVCQYG